VELRLLLAAVRRGSRLLAIALLLGVVAGVALCTQVPRHYEARASLLIDPGAVLVPGQQPYTGDPERYVGDQVNVLSSQGLAQRAAQEVPGSTADEVTKAVALEHVTGSDTITVVATTDSPQNSQAIANAVTDVYLQDRRAPARAAIDSQRTALQSQIDQLQSRLSSMGNAANQQATRDTLLARYNTLLTSLSALTSPGATQDNSSVTEPAALPAAATSAVGSGTVVGGTVLLALFAGFAVALVREVRQPHVMSMAHTELVVGRDVVAALPAAGRLGRDGAGAAGVGRLLAMIGSRAPVDLPRTVAVCSATDAVATEAVVRAMVAALAQQGSRVAIVDLVAADAAGSSGPADGSPQAAPATASVPASVATATAAAEHPGGSPGSTPGAPSQVALYRARTGGSPWDVDSRHYAGRLQANFDVVIVHTPAVLSNATAAPVSRTADDTVLVVPLQRELEADVRLAMEILTDQSPTRLHVVTVAAG
jgi:hypothetical protein